MKTQNIFTILFLFSTLIVTAQPIDNVDYHFNLNAPIDSPYEAELFLQDLGIKGIKWYLGWDGMEPSKGTYYWDWTDGVMTKLHIADDSLGNISFFPSISRTPDWARNYSGCEWTPPADKQDYVDFILAFLERYCPNGTFAQQNGWTDDFGITEIEIWNEPNIGYWHRDGNTWEEDAYEYMEMLKKTYTAVKTYYPFTRVTSGGFANFGYWINGIDTIFHRLEDVLPFYYEDSLKYFTDVLSIHYYAYSSAGYDDPATGMKYQISQIKNIMQTYGDPSKPVWNSEGGWRSDWPGDNVFTQANYLVRFYVVQMAKGVERIYWFHSIDEPPPDGREFGLVTPKPDMIRKPSFYTYKKLIEKLSGCDWSVVDLEPTGSNYVKSVKTVKDSINLWIVWWDYFNDTSYTNGDTFNLQLENINTSKIIVTSCIPYDTLGGVGLFNVDTIDVYGGYATIQVMKNPLIIEEMQTQSGMAEPARFELFQVYPNPFNTSLCIDIFDSRFTNYELRILDVIGKIVFEKTINSAQEILYLNLSEGIYFLQVKSSNFVQTVILEVIK